MDFRCIPGERFRDLISPKQAEIERTQHLSATELAALRELVSWDGENRSDCRNFLKVYIGIRLLDHSLAEWTKL